MRVVHELADRGVIEETDGQIDSYLNDDNAPVLLTVGFLDDSAIGQFVNGAGDCASFGAAGG
ncbi:hypothetical protein MAHJHV28_46020 [Mycobacterium avium subsp. hominissuis]